MSTIKLPVSAQIQKALPMGCYLDPEDIIVWASGFASFRKDLDGYRFPSHEYSVFYNETVDWYRIQELDCLIWV
jgi:hypothetical protein